ncbi:protein YIPF3-like [Bacillus rossius redtenbacheri]|uniref:protein YIPF3-like n=1 Tax=Bacillus rossius redtenbacheri TaxID=93214 RepID=UPI002FDEBED8
MQKVLSLNRFFFFCKMDKKGVSVVFIDDIYARYSDDYSVKDHSKNSVFSVIRPLFSVPVKELPQRFLISLVPPLTTRYRYIYSDLLGPVVILVMLAALLHYGHASKLPSAATSISPGEALAGYVALVPALSYVLVRAGAARITMRELLSLLGYGLSGHVLALGVSLVFYHEMSNTFFYCCLTLFGGLSALRVALVLLAVIPVLAARLIVCSVVATVQLLSILFLHFAYMHRTFVYGAARVHKH